MRTLPKYIAKFVEERRLKPCFYDDKDFCGYTFRFNQRFSTTEDGRFQSDLQRLENYAKRNHADVKVIKCDYHMNGRSRIWSAIIGITDPVAYAIETLTNH